MLLHGFLLALPARETLPEISDRPLRVQLDVTETQPPPAPAEVPEQQVARQPATEGNDTSVNEAPVADNGNIDWYAEARKVINESAVDTDDMLLESAPLQQHGLSVDDTPARIPGLQGAFSPLPRTRKVCAAETTIDFGYYSITMPVVYSCTIEEKRAQMEGHEPPEAR